VSQGIQFVNPDAGAAMGGEGGSSKVVDFPLPWLDYASACIPNSLTLVLRWAEYIWMSNGTYRQACQRTARYFITDLEFKEIEDDHAEDVKDIFEHYLKIRTLLSECGDNYLCFHGDTKAVTRDGVFKLRDLAGKTVDVLSQGGVYRKAEFKSFGRQSLLEVEFSDKRTVLATPEHQWVVRGKNALEDLKVPTTALKGRSIPRTVAPRPAQGEEFNEGVRHGFVFGDGSTYNKHTTQRCVANFYGAKDAPMLKYFEGHGSPPSPCEGLDLVKVHGLPSHFKTLPSPTASAEYWYGFVCGFMAADESVDTYGCSILAQKSKATLEAIAEQLPRIGMAAGPVPVRGHWREADLSPWDGGEPGEYYYQGDMHCVTLLQRFMLPQDILLPCHLAKFLANQKDTNYGEVHNGCRCTGDRHRG